MHIPEQSGHQFRSKVDSESGVPFWSESSQEFMPGRFQNRPFRPLGKGGTRVIIYLFALIKSGAHGTTLTEYQKDQQVITTPRLKPPKIHRQINLGDVVKLLTYCEVGTPHPAPGLWREIDFGCVFRRKVATQYGVKWTTLPAGNPLTRPPTYLSGGTLSLRERVSWPAISLNRREL